MKDPKPHVKRLRLSQVYTKMGFSVLINLWYCRMTGSDKPKHYHNRYQFLIRTIPLSTTVVPVENQTFPDLDINKWFDSSLATVVCFPSQVKHHLVIEVCEWFMLEL